MNTLYWIHVLGNLSTASSILAILLGIATFALIISYIACRCDDEPDKAKVCGRWSVAILCVTILNTMISVFTPNKGELYLIYGVGGTIDYLRNNPTASQLPDKTIKMLDLMADEFIDKHSRTSNGNENTKENEPANEPETE